MTEKYQYNTKYKNEHYDNYRKECMNLYGSQCMLDLSKECDVKMFHNLVGIDESRVPDAYDMKVFMAIPCKWHNKKTSEEAFRFVCLFLKCHSDCRNSCFLSCFPIRVCCIHLGKPCHPDAFLFKCCKCFDQA